MRQHCERLRRSALLQHEVVLDDRRHRVAALAQARAVDAIAVVAEHHRPRDAARVLGAHVELHLQVLGERYGRAVAEALDRSGLLAGPPKRSKCGIGFIR